MNKKLLIIFFVIFIVISLFVGTMILFLGNSISSDCTIETKGMIIGYEVGYSNGDEIYYPIARYEANGEIIENQSGFGRNSMKYSILEEVTIFYNPENVYSFIIEGENVFSVLGYIPYGISAIMFVLMILTYFDIIKPKNNYNTVGTPKEILEATREAMDILKNEKDNL